LKVVFGTASKASRGSLSV